MMAFAGAFTTIQQLMHPHCFVYYDKTWNLDEDSFDMLNTKHHCWAAIPDPISTTNVPYERKINISFTDNNFMICLFDFVRLSIESRFPFLFLFTHTVYNWKTLPWVPWSWMVVIGALLRLIHCYALDFFSECRSEVSFDTQCTGLNLTFTCPCPTI